MTEVVCDAGPLIHLDEIGWLDLLNGFDAVLVPRQVWREAVRHRVGLEERGHFEHPVVDVVIAPSAPFQTLVRTFVLGVGEQAALSLALSRPGALVLTDDAAARLAAKALGLRAYGTLGVLLRAIRRRQRSRDEVLDVLRSLRSRSTLYVRADLLQEVVAEVESL